RSVKGPEERSEVSKVPRPETCLEGMSRAVDGFPYRRKEVGVKLIVLYLVLLLKLPHEQEAKHCAFVYNLGKDRTRKGFGIGICFQTVQYHTKEVCLHSFVVR